MLAGLNELVDAIQLGVRERHRAQEEAVVSGINKDWFQGCGHAPGQGTEVYRSDTRREDRCVHDASQSRVGARRSR